MSRTLRYLTHPQVSVNSTIPVPEWQLSAEGRKRVEKLNPVNLTNTRHIVSSDEVKAVQTAKIISNLLGTGFRQRQAMGENDRSSTGFLPPDEFETMADAFFASPNECIRGWERAIDAQTRIIAETQGVVQENRTGDILLVGHGAVGTLLYCHFAGQPVDRKFDQKCGGGNYFSVDLHSGKALHHWKPMENL